MYIYIWQRLKEYMPRTVPLENGQTVRYLKGLNNNKFTSRNSFVFVLLIISDFLKQTSEIHLCRHIHA